MLCQPGSRAGRDHVSGALIEVSQVRAADSKWFGKIGKVARMPCSLLVHYSPLLNKERLRWTLSQLPLDFGSSGERSYL